jgi:hypothetical protein
MLHLQRVGVKGRGARSEAEEKSDIGGRLFIATVANVCNKGFTRLNDGFSQTTERDDHDDHDDHPRRP